MMFLNKLNDTEKLVYSGIVAAAWKNNTKNKSLLSDVQETCHFLSNNEMSTIIKELASKNIISIVDENDTILIDKTGTIIYEECFRAIEPKNIHVSMLNNRK